MRELTEKEAARLNAISPGGGFGVVPQDILCAVDGCENPGMPQRCPADGAYHRHGMVHYTYAKPGHGLTFREGWHLICDEHYKVIA